MAQLSEPLVRDAIRCIREERKLNLTINEVDQALWAWLMLNGYERQPVETSAALTWETFWAKVRESNWNPTPAELKSALFEYEQKHCCCDDFQGVNLRCSIHGQR